MVSLSAICDAIIGTVFTFKTPRLVRVRSVRIGLIFRFIQLIIIAYIIGWIIIYNKGYQVTDIAESTVTAKVKGIANTFDHPLDQYKRIWDTPDYVIPPQQNGAFFVMTNAIITNQAYEKCPEDLEIARCHSLYEDHKKCSPNTVKRGGNGVMSGRCIMARKDTQARSCEILAWCPLESKEIPHKKPLLLEAENFTVFIKNIIEFPEFNVKRSNIPENVNSTYISQCKHADGFTVDDSKCPVFTLGYITKEAGVDFSDIAWRGGVINIAIHWNCDLDQGASECNPSYKFKRLDNDGNNASIGWNFRYANYYLNRDDKQARTLVKVFGILFVFSVNGHAGKFSIVPLLVRIGACVAFLGLATLVCDLILLYVDKNKDRYKDTKFLEVTEGHFQIDKHNGNTIRRPPSVDQAYNVTPKIQKHVYSNRQPSMETCTSNAIYYDAEDGNEDAWKQRLKK